jgi:hypothetical protein
MSAYRVTSRFRVVVLPSSHSEAHHEGGKDLPLDFPDKIGALGTVAPPGVAVLPLFRPAPTFANSTHSIPTTQSVSLSMRDVEHGSALLGPLTWPFVPLLRDSPLTLGRDAAIGQSQPMLPHKFASREHVQIFVTPKTFGYNANAETLAVTIKQIGKNGTFVDGVRIGANEEKALNLFHSADGSAAFANTSQLRAAEQTDFPSPTNGARLDSSVWAGGCRDASLLVPVRLVVAARLSFPSEFSKVLPVVLIIAEVVMPRHHRSAAVRASPSLKASSDVTRQQDIDTDETDDTPPPAFRAPRSGANEEGSPSASFKAQQLKTARPPVDTDPEDDDEAPPARRNRAEGTMSGSIAGFKLVPSSDDDDDDAEEEPAVRRMTTALTSVSAVPAPGGKLAGWAAAVEKARVSGATDLDATGVLGAKKAPAKKSPKRLKSPAQRSPHRELHLASNDDVPLIVEAGVTDTRRAQVTLEQQPPRMVKAASIIRVGSSTDDLLLRPRAAPPPPGKAPVPAQKQGEQEVEPCMWQWKSRRTASDADPSSWTSYPLADSATIEAAFQRNDTSVKLTEAFRVDFRAADGPTQVSTLGTGASRKLRRVTGSAAAELKRNAASAAAGATWSWNSNVHVPDSDPKAWSPYPPSDSAKLEAAYMKGEPTVTLNANYSVAFNDKSAGMVQYRTDDRSRWRQVKRVGGPERPKHVGLKAVKAVVVDSDESTDASGSSASTGSDDEYSGVASDSDDDDWLDSSDSDAPAKKRNTKVGKPTH